jgi:dTDP-glucose 4,6-dehydratase
MATVLITGVAGFIGSNFARRLARRYPGHRLVGVDTLSPFANRANVADLEADGRLTLHVADITDATALEEVYAAHGVELVVNFAAESHNDRAILDPSRAARTNALGAQTLLEVSRKSRVRRHLHVSTIEVYGEQGDGAAAFTEASPLNAKTPYSAAKAAGDLFVRAYMQTYPGLDVCLTHCANNYGPYQFPEKLIPLTVTNALQGKKVPLYGDGLQRRDWLHVCDHCRALDLVLHRSGKPALNPAAATRPELLPIYDISARQEVTNREVVRLVLDELGLAFEDWVEAVTDRPNHDRRYRIEPAKIERELGFRPSIPLGEGIRRTVRWYVENQRWWRDILARTDGLQVDWGKVAV